jgi:uncharacterized protein (TIRG00374 family)
MSLRSHQPVLSVVIPAHNCGALIDDTVRRIANRLADRLSEIIVVENGSTDDTWRRCRDLEGAWNHPGASLVVLQSPKGMGNALRAGTLVSLGRSVLLTADDLPFGFDDIDAADRLLGEIGELPPIIIGSKAHPDSAVNRGFIRDLLTGGFAVMRRLVLGMRTGDPQGTILMDGELARTLAAQAGEPGFLYTTELIHLAEREGIRPAEVAVRLSADHSAHPSRVSLADVWGMAIGLCRLRGRSASARSQSPAAMAGDAGHGRRGLLRLSIGVALSAVFLWLTVQRTNVSEVWSGFASLQLPLLAVALLICLIEVGVRAVRWRFLLLRTVRISLLDSYAYICIGHFANAMLPFRLGDAARAYLAGGTFGASRLMVLGTILVERLADGFTLLGIVAIAVAAGVAMDTSWMAILLVAGGVGLCAIAIAIPFRRMLSDLIARRLPALVPQLRAFAGAFGFALSFRSVAVVLAMTLASFGLSVVILQAALLASGVSLVWWQVAVAIGVMTLSTAIPAAPGAVGTYEFVGTSALTAFGVPAGSALVAVVAVHLLATIPPAFIGLATTLVLHVDVLGMHRGVTTPVPVEAFASTERG